MACLLPREAMAAPLFGARVQESETMSETFVANHWTKEDLKRDPRSVREADFPVGGSTSEKLRFLLNYAILAPSSRNTQPWIWRESIEALHLYADPDRMLPVSDPEEREMVIACGVALSFLVIAMRAFGLEPKVTRFPDPRNLHYLAKVNVVENRQPSEEDRALFAAITRRHTNYGLFDSHQVPREFLNRIRMDAVEMGLWLHTVAPSEERQELVEIIANGDLEQWENAAFASESAHWIHSRSSPAKDGVPAQALSHSSLQQRALPLAMRVTALRHLMHLPESLSEQEEVLAASAPLLAILGTSVSRDSPSEWLSGEGLGKILLRATAAGFSVSFFNSPVHVKHLWPKIFQIVGHNGVLQLVFSVGYPLESSVLTPRRPGGEVLRA